MLRFRKIYFTISGLMVVASIIALVMFGLNLGIDFTGGSLLEITIDSGDVTAQQIEEVLEKRMHYLFVSKRTCRSLPQFFHPFFKVIETAIVEMVDFAFSPIQEIRNLFHIHSCQI